MVDKRTLKEIIVSNEEFITNSIGNVVSREGVVIPEKLNKVIVLYGVRRSGKTLWRDTELQISLYLRV